MLPLGKRKPLVLACLLYTSRCVSEPGIGDAAQKAEYIFLAIKPQNYPEALPELIPYCKSGKVIITIAAGISSEYIMTALGYKCKVIRVMPNTPLLLGYGATAMCASEMITEEELNIVSNIFKSCGIVEYIPETLMNAVICCLLYTSRCV